MGAPGQSIESVVQAVADRARALGVFGGVEMRSGMLVCRAKASAAPASYRVFAEDGRLWVALVMADRWLSESIETDLLHTGDKVEDLLEEELAELDYQTGGVRPIVEHFRSDDLLFTFRSPAPSNDAETVGAWLLAYEACFRRLGDMETGGDED